MRGVINQWGIYATLSAFALVGCNTESTGGGPTIQTEPFFCAGGVCSLARGVALDEEYADLVSEELESGNVILKAANQSQLVVNGPINSETGHTLTLHAENDIYIYESIGSSGKLVINNPGHELYLREKVYLEAGPNLRVNGEEFTVITELGAPGSTTGSDLQGINGAPAANYALGRTIFASDTAHSGEVWGNGFDPIDNFSGKFFGLGHTISTLHIAPSSSTNGMFNIAGNATFRDVIFTYPFVISDIHAGVIAGSIDNNVNVTVSGVCIVGGYIEGDTAGAMFGGIYSGRVTIKDSCAIANNYDANDFAGGLVADVDGGTLSIRKSHAQLISLALSVGAEAFGLAPTAPGVTLDDNFFHNIPNGNNSSSVPGATALTDSTFHEPQIYLDAGWDISANPEDKNLWLIEDYRAPVLNIFRSSFTYDEHYDFLE